MTTEISIHKAEQGFFVAKGYTKAPRDRNRRSLSEHRVSQFFAEGAAARSAYDTLVESARGNRQEVLDLAA